MDAGDLARPATAQLATPALVLTEVVDEALPRQRRTPRAGASEGLAVAACPLRPRRTQAQTELPATTVQVQLQPCPAAKPDSAIRTPPTAGGASAGGAAESKAPSVGPLPSRDHRKKKAPKDRSALREAACLELRAAVAARDALRLEDALVAASEAGMDEEELLKAFAVLERLQRQQRQ